MLCLCGSVCPRDLTELQEAAHGNLYATHNVCMDLRTDKSATGLEGIDQWQIAETAVKYKQEVPLTHLSLSIYNFGLTSLPLFCWVLLRSIIVSVAPVILGEKEIFPPSFLPPPSVALPSELLMNGLIEFIAGAVRNAVASPIKGAAPYFYSILPLGGANSEQPTVEIFS